MAGSARPSSGGRAPSSPRCGTTRRTPLRAVPKRPRRAHTADRQLELITARTSPSSSTPRPGPCPESSSECPAMADVSAFGWSTSGSSATGSSAARTSGSTAGASSPSSQHRDLAAAGLRLKVDRSGGDHAVDWVEIGYTDMGGRGVERIPKIRTRWRAH